MTQQIFLDWILLCELYSPVEIRDTQQTSEPTMSPSKFVYWNLTPKVMVVGGGTFGRWLGH